MKLFFRASFNGRLILLLIIILYYNHIAEGCRCLNRGLHQSYFNEDKHMMKVEVLGRGLEREKDDNGNKRFIKRIHVAKVITNYKGETNEGEYILITSPLHSCGVKLTKGIWLASFSAVPNGEKGGLGVYSIHDCDYSSSWKDLDKIQRTFLDTRMVCDEQGICTCGDGSIAMMCKSLLPCITSTCDTSEKCFNNYCGGCRAEWIDETYQLECQCMKGDSICAAE